MTTGEAKLSKWLD